MLGNHGSNIVALYNNIKIMDKYLGDLVDKVLFQKDFLNYTQTRSEEV